MLNKFYGIMFLVIALSISVSGQTTKTNLNPDPNGDPWFVDNYKMPDIMNVISDETVKETISARGEKNLPESLNHISSKYLRPIFNQSGGSCGAAAQISYMFAYEINNHRDADASLPQNIYPSHFTFMTSDGNANQPQMAAFNGIPNSIMWGGDTYSTIFGKSVDAPDDYPDYGWMTGFGRWKNAMLNKIEYNDFIFIDSPDKLEFLKGWILDHNGEEGFHEGGLAGTGIAISNSDIVQIPPQFNEGGKYLLKEWGPQFDHAMTWAGWDDNVGYDYNGDGQLTNDVDLNNDGIINMLDWEKGSMLLLNSWGDQWANGGWVYIPYRVLRKHKMIAEFYHVRKDYSPKMILKVKMTYNQRNRLKLLIGIASRADASKPDKTRLCPHFVFQGRAEVPMLGRWADNIMHEEPMEFELDLTDLLYGFDLTKPFTVFLKTVTTRTGGEGNLDYLSVVDYIGNSTGVEYIGEFDDTEIRDGKIQYFPISLSGNPAADIPQYVYIPQSSMSVYYVDSEESISEKATNVLDGKINTIWHTDYNGGVDLLPHVIEFELDEETSISGIEYIGRQNGGAGANGRIADYEVYVAMDPDEWGEPVATGKFNNTSMPQRVFFPSINGKYIKLVALSETNGQEWTSMAEFNAFTKYNATGVEGEIEAPFKYSLSQNYPNPFNPSTVIKYSLANSGFVSLKIFDALGKEVKNLIDDYKPAGNYSVEFNGNGLSSGIYFYRLTAGDYVSAKKMILLK